MATDSSNIIIDELKDIEWESILEVGASRGYVLKEVKKEFPDKIIKGVDNEYSFGGVSYDGVIAMGQELGLDITFGDGRNLEFEDKSFDIVFCQAVLVMSLIEDFKKIISEMIRVAKKRVVIIDLHSEEKSKDGEYYSEQMKDHRLIANYRFLEDEGYNVIIKKFPDGLWGTPDSNWGKWGHIITINL
jgi:ubiquinone/menaquinone biosynthesis C-methylase UbiE